MCGESSDGKFGVPEKTSRNKPHLVNTLAGKRVKSLSMGGYFVIAVLGTKIFFPKITKPKTTKKLLLGEAFIMEVLFKCGGNRRKL